MYDSSSPSNWGREAESSSLVWIDEDVNTLLHQPSKYGEKNIKRGKLPYRRELWQNILILPNILTWKLIKIEYIQKKRIDVVNKIIKIYSRRFSVKRILLEKGTCQINWRTICHKRQNVLGISSTFTTERSSQREQRQKKSSSVTPWHFLEKIPEWETCPSFGGWWIVHTNTHQLEKLCMF